MTNCVVVIPVQTGIHVVFFKSGFLLLAPVPPKPWRRGMGVAEAPLPPSFHYGVTGRRSLVLVLSFFSNPLT